MNVKVDFTLFNSLRHVIDVAAVNAYTQQHAPTRVGREHTHRDVKEITCRKTANRNNWTCSTHRLSYYYQGQCAQLAF